MNKKVAFTLAEVLITLGIIGVVATLTIPTLLNFASEREQVSRAKETYSLLSQAILQWQTDNGCVSDSTKCDNNPWYPIGKQILPYLKTSEYYNFGVNDSPVPTVNALSWVPTKSTTLSGGRDSASGLGYGIFEKNSQGYDLVSMAVLANGSVIAISGNNTKDCLIVFDTNGSKNPNRMGKDQFAASLANSKSKTFNPYYQLTFWGGVPVVNGLCNTVAVTTCNPDDGHSPMAYVLTHDKLPDFQSMGYPTAP